MVVALTGFNVYMYSKPFYFTHHHIQTNNIDRCSPLKFMSYLGHMKLLEIKQSCILYASNIVTML